MIIEHHKQTNTDNPRMLLDESADEENKMKLLHVAFWRAYTQN